MSANATDGASMIGPVLSFAEVEPFVGRILAAIDADTPDNSRESMWQQADRDATSSRDYGRGFAEALRLVRQTIDERR